MSNVVFLAHRNPEMDSDNVEHLSCKNCKNKTFTLTHLNNSNFPTVKCACCTNDLGEMGWVNEEDQ